MTESKSLAEAFPLEQARLRELIDAYRDIGPAGAFGLAMIRQTLLRADAAAMSGDVVAKICIRDANGILRKWVPADLNAAA